MSRTLVLVDCEEALTPDLCASISERAAVVLLSKVPKRCEFGAAKCPTFVLPGFDRAASRWLEVLRPVMEMGSNNEGPNLDCARISFLSATDFSLFSQGRFAWGLLNQLQTIAENHVFDSVEVITGAWHGGRCLPVVRAFAAGTARTCKRRTIGSWKNRLKSHAFEMRQLLGSFGAGRKSINASRKDAIDSHHDAVDAATRQFLHVGMLVYQPKSWRYLLPIRDVLLERGHRVTLLSPRQATGDYLLAEGLPFVSLPDVSASAKFIAEIGTLVDSLPFQFDGKIEEAIGEPGGALRCWIKDVSRDFVADYVRYGGTLPLLFERLGINCVMGTDSGSIAGRCHFRTAEAMSIPSVFVQHGAFSVEPGVAEYFTQSRKLVWGESSQSTLCRAGVPTDSVEIVGSPWVEHQLAEKRTRDSNIEIEFEVLVAFGVPGNTISETEFARAAWEVIDTAQSLEEARFVIKPHPGDRSGIWRRLIDEAGKPPNIEIRPEKDTYLLIDGCRVLITMFSTTGAEAIYRGKPVISVNLDGVDWGMDYVEQGAAYIIRERGGLKQLLQHLFATPIGEDSLAGKRRAYVSASLFQNNDLAENRIAAILEKVVGLEMTSKHA